MDKPFNFFLKKAYMYSLRISFDHVTYIESLFTIFGKCINVLNYNFNYKSFPIFKDKQFELRKVTGAVVAYIFISGQQTS